MLTIEKLRVWETYHGDDDAYARGKKPEPEIIAPGEWGQIRNLIGDIRMNRFCSQMRRRRGAGSRSRPRLETARPSQAVEPL